MQRLNGLVAADSRGSADVTDSDLVVARLRPHVALSDISRAVALSDGNSQRLKAALADRRAAEHRGWVRTNADNVHE